MLARLLEGVAERALVYARTAARAEHVAAELARRGIGHDSIRVVAFGRKPESEATRVISYDVPFAADDLQAHHARGGTVLVTPFELPHLQRMAAEVPFTLKHRRAKLVEGDALAAFRSQIRAAFDTEDLDAHMLVLEPLFEERSAAEVAAALSALLRRRSPTATPVIDAGAPSAAARPAAPATFTRLFVSIGTRDNVRPGDLVGAITNEAHVPGSVVGAIQINEGFSLVDVQEGVADAVVVALRDATIRGRRLQVRRDS
jgi:ATP-dependent RNA helicase DeaD